MIKTCEILVTTWDEGQVVAGKITLENGKLSSHPNKGWNGVLKEVRESKIRIKEKEYDPKEDPAGWFRNLPKYYSGSMVRAQIKENE